MAAGRSANAGLGGKTAAGESDDSSAGRRRACRRASGANAGEDTGLGGKTAAGESDDSSAGLAAANGWAANGWPKADCKRTRKLSSFSSYVYVYEYSSSSAIVLQMLRMDILWILPITRFSEEINLIYI